jgi:hypothetical protein
MSELRRVLDVKFIYIDGLVDLSDRYRAMSDCYRLAMKDDTEGTYWVFLTADCVLSNGAVRSIQRRIAEGYGMCQ